MIDAKGFRLAMVILALAWLMIFAALAFAFANMPAAFADPYAIWSLVASGAAVVGAILTRGFHMIGVVLYCLGALSLIIKSYFVVTDAPVPVGWPYILGLLLFTGLVWSQWGMFRRPNA